MSEEQGQVRKEELDQPARARRRLALAQIRQYGDPALRMTAREVDTFDEDLERLAERMIALMHDASGVGLAANQVGVLQRLFVVEPADEEPRTLVNPRIVERSAETVVDDEGCLSLQGVLVPVERHVQVTVEALDVHGEPLRLEFSDLGARVVQHELDHLDGTLIIDRTDPESRRGALATLRPKPVLYSVVARIAVAATAPFGADVLERLAAHHEIASVLTRPDKPAGRGRHETSPPAKVVAERLGIPVLQPERLDASLDLDAPTVVVAAYGVLIPAGVLEGRLWLNVHPSLLPRWRGAAPVERAIMAGDRESGVTIHETVEALDAGPIAAQSAFPIGPEDDAGAVYARAAEVAAGLLDGVLSGEPSFTPQSGEVTYADKITAADRELDWSLPPQELLDRIRALSPHIGARGELDGRRLTIWRARLEDGKLVPVEVQPEGKRRMTYDEFLRGLR